MPKYKKDINTTSPVAVRHGQSDYHVPDEAPWHINARTITCPECDTVYIVDQGFSEKDLLAELRRHHQLKKQHPPYIAFDPAFTTVTDCECA